MVLEIRYADGHDDKLAGLATEQVRLNPDVIIAQSGVASLAVRNKTRTIPIVMASSGDAVRQGLVKSLARPGGNVTGLTLLSPELSQKRLEVLREMLPTLSRVGERIINLERLFNVREGVRRAQDVLPWRVMHEPIPDGPSAGMHCPPAELSAMLDEYYALRGWDADGVPTPARLASLGLSA